jgi:uncharacterized protein with ParB-like and HNH nuclease domain
MKDYLRKSISEVIEEINKVYYLPDIQRSFVWKPNQVYSLFDSLLRDYPINTFLFWILNGKTIKELGIKKLEFVSNSTDKSKVSVAVNSDKEYYLVLDGQQRLTTFFLVLKGNYIIRNKPYELYYNVLSGVDEIDEILYEFKFFNSRKDIVFIEKNDDGEIEKLWYSIKEIYDTKDSYDTAELVDELEKKYDIKLEKKQRKDFSRLIGYLKHEKVVYYYPETEKDEDRVLDIFVRTNSGGTLLSYSDLLFSNIKSQWKDARESFNDLLCKINDADKYKYSNDFILKTILFFNASDTSQIKYRTMNFKPDLINKIKDDDYWKKFTKSVKLVADLIKDNFYLTNNKLISSYNAIIPLIYWVFENNIKGIGKGKNFIDDDTIVNMRTWLIKALLSGVFGGMSDTILIKCKESIDDNIPNFKAEEIEKKIKKETKKDMEITSDDLDKIKYNDSTSYLVLSIIYKFSINFQPHFIGNIPEQDHLFSQDELSKAGISEDLINSIYNIRYVGKAPNQSKSNKPFNEWIISQNKKDKEMHLIPDGNWDVADFEKFLKKRKKLILENFKY